MDQRSKSHHCWKTYSVEANTPHNPMQGKTPLNMFESLFLSSWMLFSLMQSSQERIQLWERNNSIMPAEVVVAAGR